MSTVQVSRTTSTVEVSATRPRVEVGTPSIVAHNDVSGRDAADAHPIGAITGLIPLPTADGSRYVVSHPGGANPPAWSSQAAWKDQAGEFTQAQRFPLGSASAPSIAIGASDTGLAGISSGVVAVLLSGITRLRITSSSVAHNQNAAEVGVGGVIGVGAGFEVFSPDSGNALNTLTTFGGSSQLILRKANGTGAAPTATTNGSVLGQIGFRGYGASGWAPGNRAYILSASTEAWTDSAQGARISIFTTPAGSASATEAVEFGGALITVYKQASIADSVNIAVGTTTGTKIGTATAQKLGFWNATPVIQPAAAGQAAPAAQVQAALTDSTGGTASTTLASITAGATYLQADLTAIKNAIASLAARLAEVKTDVANVKTLEDAIRTALVNTGLIKGAA